MLAMFVGHAAIAAILIVATTSAVKPPAPVVAAAVEPPAPLSAVDNLVAASRSGDLKAVKRELENGADINGIGGNLHV